MKSCQTSPLSFRVQKLLALLCVASVTACSSTEKIKPEPLAKELKKASSRSVDTPEEELIKNAKRYYASGLYSVARESFESLRDSYPSGPYGEFARIKIADTYFDTGEYGTAATQYEEFIKTYPTSPSLPYSLLRAGRSHQLSSRGAGRDVSPVEKAVGHYDAVISKYPESPYAKAAKDLRATAVQTLAEHDRFIADFYQHQQKDKAAEAREEIFRTKWRRIEGTAEPKDTAETEGETESSDQVGALHPPAVLAALRTKPAPRRVVLRAPQIPSTETPPGGENISGDGPVTVRKVECERSGGKKIFLYLNRSVDDSSYISRIQRSPSPVKAGYLTLRLPKTTTRQEVLDCFGSKDLVLSQGGVITLRGARSAEVMTLESPPRLLLTVR